MCVDVSTTPLGPSGDNPYGQAIIIFWCTVGLAIAYWILVGLARIVSAWSRGRGGLNRSAGVWPNVQSLGYVLASAISGERLSASPALLRFCACPYTLWGSFLNIYPLRRHAISSRRFMAQSVVHIPRHDCRAMAPIHLYVTFPPRESPRSQVSCRSSPDPDSVVFLDIQQVTSPKVRTVI